MTDWELSRRKLLALFGVTGASTLSYQAFISNSEDPATSKEMPESLQNETSSPIGTKAERKADGTRADVADIREYGAKIDGETNDAPAVQEAIKDIPSGGMVFLPSGDILIDTPEDARGAITLGEEKKDVRFIGAVSSNAQTTLHMAPNQDETHYGFHITGENREPDDQVVLANFSINLTSSEQDTVGTAIRTESTDGILKIRNCSVTSTRNGGVKMVGGMDGDIQNCVFEDNGVESYGHAISPNQSKGKTTTVIKNVFCANQRGVSIDIGLGEDATNQTVEIESCVLKNSMGGVKINPTAASVTVRNTRIVGSREIPVKMNPYEYHMGEVLLDNVLIDGGGWPGIDFPNPTSLEINDVAIKNVDKNNIERDNDRGGIRTDEVDFRSSGRVSIHNVGKGNSGPALKIFDGSGSIEEVRHDGTGGLGQLDGVKVKQNIRAGSPIEPDVPSESDVGLADYSS